jgi:hypothetical protein
VRCTATRSDALDQLVAALQSGVCDPAAARELWALGPDTVTLALLAATRRIAEQDTRLETQAPGLDAVRTRYATIVAVPPAQAAAGLRSPQQATPRLLHAV